MTAPAGFEVSRKRSTAAVGRERHATYMSDRNEIVEALQRWAREFGEPPRGIDLKPARARRLGHEWRADRFEAGDRPSTRMISKQFGSLTAAMEAAGLKPRQAPVRSAANLTGPSAIWMRSVPGPAATARSRPSPIGDPARARRLHQDWRIARYHRGGWPSTRTVIARVGSMGTAIKAAGLALRPIGSHRRASLERMRGNSGGLA